MVRLVDLSLPIRNFSMESQAQWSNPKALIYIDHEEGARRGGKKHGINPADFTYPYSKDSTTIVTASAHAGTHMDAPYHFGPESEGKPAKRIDQVPLEWCYSNGVVLDFSRKATGELISAADMEQACKEIDYELQPFDIVLIRTDTDKYWDEVDFKDRHPGMTRESTLWALDRGVKIIGIDAWSVDAPLNTRPEEQRPHYWEAHYTGREREYCVVEKLANLDQLPSHGFTVSLLPIKLDRADAGWVRAVAIVED